MKTPAQWREIYPVAEEVVKAIQVDTLLHAANLADNHAVGRNCVTCVTVAHSIARNLEYQARLISPHPILPVSPDPAQRVADPADNPGSGGREGGEG